MINIRSKLLNSLFIIIFLQLSACATSTSIKAVTGPAKIEQARIQAEQHEQARIEFEANEKKRRLIAQQETPLFHYMKSSSDSIMLPNEAMQTSHNDADAFIIGNFPGQRDLPSHFYEEAAVSQDLNKGGTVSYIKDLPAKDLWQRIRAGYALPVQANKRIDTHLRWFSRHQSYLDRVVKRADKYLYVIVEEAERLGIPLELALLPIVESAFQPFAYSHGRAAGIWQFIPSTGKLYGLKQNWWYDGRRDIVASSHAALKFLKGLHRSLNHDWLLALAAYNSGYGTVTKAIRKNKRKGLPTDFWSLSLPKETRGYVPKLIAIADIINNPKKFNVSINAIKNEAYMAKVDTKSQIDLALAAELADISLEDLYILNPGFNRWATSPKGPHHLMVPVNKAETFTTNLAALPDNKRLSWLRHKIKRGQSLLVIADKYNTTVALIKELNQIRNNTIRAGKNLIIPVSSRKGKNYTLSAEQRLLALQNTKRKGHDKLNYRVRNGDTLWSISRKYDVGYRSLAKWNGLAPRDTLRTGQKLVIWSKAARASRAKFSPHSAQLVTQKINYRVRRGDSLALISQKFNINLNDLVRWNKKLAKRKYLQPGQRLTLYVDVTQQGGQT